MGEWRRNLKPDLDSVREERSGSVCPKAGHPLLQHEQRRCSVDSLSFVASPYQERNERLV